jgi:hypothetical protein
MLEIPERLEVLRTRGRPRIAPAVTMVSLLIPDQWHDLCSREALARDVPLAVVFREAILASRQRRGEL